MLQPGRICYKTKGRNAGKKVIVLSLDGAFAKVLQHNGKEKRVSIRHLFPTKEVIDMSIGKEEMLKYIR